MLNRQLALVDVRVIVLRGDAVLLIRLSAGEFIGRWNLPGGHVMLGEDVVAEPADRRKVFSTTVRITASSRP